MKIVSLLPSATEIVFALGLGDALEAVTFECDYPPAARGKPVVSTTALPDDQPMTAAEIDAAVTAAVARGEPIYRLDAQRIAAIDPDVILSQDLCRVCAVPTGDVEAALGVLGCRAEVVSLDPATLDDVIACIGRVGDATGTGERAAELMAQLTARVDAVRDAGCRLGSAANVRARVVGPAVQRRPLGRRHDRRRGRRSGAHGARRTVAPARLGRDRARATGPRRVHAVWLWTGRRRRRGSRAPRPA